jgi:hypothetical protein
MREKIRDKAAAKEIAEVEADCRDDAAGSRARIRKIIESRYTAQTEAPSP